MTNSFFNPPPKSFSKSFTLIELIVVIIIVGILAAVGISQYSLTVEKGRTAEAKIRIGTMRQLAYQYWLENGNMTNIANADVGVDDTCSSNGFYRYSMGGALADAVALVAVRCASGGKTPNTRSYQYYIWFWPGTGLITWHCFYFDNGTPCYGLPT